MEDADEGREAVNQSDLRQRLDENGFLVLRDFLPRESLQGVSERLGELYDRFDHLPSSRAQDIAVRAAGIDEPLRNAEINRAIRLDPRLKRSDVFRRCLRLARGLRGRTTSYVFDHAIAKQPNSKAETPWHQDQAFTGHRTVLRTVHFWIPLQDVDEQNGCMHFVPRSHLSGLLTHRTERNASGGVVHSIPAIDPARGRAVPLRAGGITVHTPLTVHFAGANRSDSVRHAWILHFGPFGWLSKLRPSLLLERYFGHRHA